MRVLVIEDTDSKFNNIKEYLEAYDVKTIARKKSINGGLMELRRSVIEGDTYDLVVLDMILPRYEDEPGRLFPEGGIQVLNEIERKDYNLKVVFCSSDAVDPSIYESKDHVIGFIKYSPIVYLQPEFERMIKRIEDLKPEETYVTIYYSFDANAIKKFNNRKEALDYISTDFDEEMRIQLEENGKILGIDIEGYKDVEKDEIAKITFKNGEFIEWSIPNVI